MIKSHVLNLSLKNTTDKTCCLIRMILRNHLVQHAIELAEDDDYTEVRRLLEELKHPFDLTNRQGSLIKTGILFLARHLIDDKKLSLSYRIIKRMFYF